ASRARRSVAAQGVSVERGRELTEDVARGDRTRSVVGGRLPALSAQERQVDVARACPQRADGRGGAPAGDLDRIRVEPPERVRVRDLLDVVVGDPGEARQETLGRGRPRAVRVRVVALPGDPVDADRVALADTGRVVDEAGEEVPAEHLARLLPAEAPARPEAVALVQVVDSLEEVRDPADAALRERDAELGKA